MASCWKKSNRYLSSHSTYLPLKPCDRLEEEIHRKEKDNRELRTGDEIKDKERPVFTIKMVHTFV